MDKLLRDYSPWPVLGTGAVVGAVGWALIINLLGKWPVSPDHDRRFLFFVALWLALGGTSLPLIWLLHRRFGRPDAGESWRSFGVLARQAAWAGAWVTACVWLQMHRMLNWAMALLLAVVLVLLEALLLMRQRTEMEFEE